MIIKNYEVLNSRQSKEIAKLLEAQWGYANAIEEGLLRRENDIFLVTREIGRISIDRLNINSLGLYFAEIHKGEMRLSIEGSQIIGPGARQNVLELNKEQLAKWLAGEDLEIETDCKGFAIVRHGKDFYGCGKVKEGRLLNYVPKARRVN